MIRPPQEKPEQGKSDHRHSRGPQVIFDEAFKQTSNQDSRQRTHHERAQKPGLRGH